MSSYSLSQNLYLVQILNCKLRNGFCVVCVVSQIH